MDWSAALSRHGASPLHAPWLLAGILLLAGLVDALLVAAVAKELFTALLAFTLHVALVVATALALRASRLAAEDILVFSVAAILSAGPLGAVASAWLAAGLAPRVGRGLRGTAGANTETCEIEQLVEELRTARTISPDAPTPPSFIQVMKLGSLPQRLAVLGVVAKSYHPDHRRIVEMALRSDSAGVRAQAAALVVSLSARARLRLEKAVEAGDAPETQIAEMVACLRSGFLEPGQVTAARDTAIALCRTARRTTHPRGPLTETLITLLLDAGAHDEAAAELASLRRVSPDTRSRCLAAFLRNGRLDAARSLLAPRSAEVPRPC